MIQETMDKKISINNSWTRTGKTKAQVEYTEANKQVERSIRVDKWKYVEDVVMTAEKTAWDGNMRYIYDSYTTKNLAGKCGKPGHLV